MVPGNKRARGLALLFGILFSIGAGFLTPNLALAAGCPTLKVAEQSGMHWCFDAGPGRGHVHLWTPGNFNAATASTVVYVHGYNGLSEPCGTVATNYVDCAWTGHGLAAQFSASKANALFVAIEAPVNNTQLRAGVNWPSLDGLKQAIRTSGNIEPPGRVMAIGHSGGGFTIAKFISGASLKHLAVLDAMYPGVPDAITSWYSASSGKTLTLVGASATDLDGPGHTPGTQSVAQSHACKAVNGVPGTIPADACVYIKSGLNHMQVVTGGAIIPLVISRLNAAAGGTSEAPTGGAGAPSGVPVTLTGPKLEIPIPNVNLSDPIVADGKVTIPYLAQYISGVYTFMISIVGLLAAVMMIIGGFQYLTSAGDSSKISAGKKRITDALIGLVLAFGSYILLYTINPNLVTFESLQLVSIKTVLAPGETEGSEIAAMAADPIPMGSAAKPASLCTTKENCKTYCDQFKIETKDWLATNTSKLPVSTAGMASPSDVVPIVKIPGVNGYDQEASPATISALKIAGAMFLKDGYVLAISSGYRNLRGQIKLACDSWGKGEDKVSKTIATPGGSMHGIGFAIDVQLWKDGKQVTMSGDSVKQQGQDPTSARYLADIMLKAGFRRLNNEIWHFEPVSAPDAGCRCKTIETCSMPPNVKC